MEPQQKKPASAVFLGPNKAISALTFERTEGGKLELGAVFHIPVRQEGPKTFYKALACKVEITETQRGEIAAMLEGNGTHDRRTTEDQGKTEVASKG
jgi:hypothetical protein